MCKVKLWASVAQSSTLNMHRHHPIYVPMIPNLEMCHWQLPVNLYWLVSVDQSAVVIITTIYVIQFFAKQIWYTNLLKPVPFRINFDSALYRSNKHQLFAMGKCWIYPNMLWIYILRVMLIFLCCCMIIFLFGTFRIESRKTYQKVSDKVME